MTKQSDKNRILINAVNQEELRIAVVSDDVVSRVYVGNNQQVPERGKIYKAVVTNVESSLEAAFVNYGAQRHGFLPLKQVSPEFFNNQPNRQGKVHIEDVITIGQEIMVRVEKEERGTKGAALTTFISLPGPYLVLMPNNPRAGGISRRIEGDERDETREVLSQLDIPENMGVIIRTAGIGRSLSELQWDLELLLKQWDVIQEAYNDNDAPFLIYQEGNLTARALRDNLQDDIDEILVDTPENFKEVQKHIQQVRPDFKSKVKQYRAAQPLFAKFSVEDQIESAFQREIQLPSGGTIVIDHTEALIAVDVNSARATAGDDIESTALNTNLEAAQAIAKQICLQDLGGLIVIDFIDMASASNRRAVENKLRESFKSDRARRQTGNISRFGLLEMSRQRLGLAMSNMSQKICPHCSGKGFTRTVESFAFSVLRALHEAAVIDGTTQVRIHLPVDAATYLINEKRSQVLDIEKHNKASIVIIPAEKMQIPQYNIERVWGAASANRNFKPSYKIGYTTSEDTLIENAPGTNPSLSTPAITADGLSETARKKTGILRRFLSSVLSSEDESKENKETGCNKGQQPKQNQQRRSNQSRRRYQDSRQSQSHSESRSQSRSRSRSQNRNQDKQDRQDRNRRSRSSDQTVMSEKSSNPSAKATTEAQNTKTTERESSTGQSSSRQKQGQRGGRRRRSSRGRNQAGNRQASTQQQSEQMPDRQSDSSSTAAEINTQHISPAPLEAAPTVEKPPVGQSVDQTVDHDDDMQPANISHESQLGVPKTDNNRPGGRRRRGRASRYGSRRPNGNKANATETEGNTEIRSEE